MLILAICLFSAEWIETTQEDFADGWFECNLYASHRGNGAVEFVGRFDLNNDGYIDIPGSDWILWGSSSGYSLDNKTDYTGKGGSDAADLDVDGYPEYISRDTVVDIFWGSANGPDAENTTSIGGTSGEGPLVADFNKDGYLDILTGPDMSILWGNDSSYSIDNMTTLPGNARFNPEVADLNKDGWMDAIVSTGEYAPNVEYIYWGTSQGFSENNQTRLLYDEEGMMAKGISVADLNADGWLDLILTFRPHNNAAILWGGENIYRSGNVTEYLLTFELPLPFSNDGRGGSNVADLDKDGYLDVVFINCTNNVPRIFWGDRNGINPYRFTDLVRSISDGTGAMVADFNNDGYLDIFVFNDDPESVLFWGPDYEHINVIDVEAHHGFAREIGNVYTREYEERYTSSVFDAGRKVMWLNMRWIDSLPPESASKMEVRTGEDSDTSIWGEWVEVGNPEEFFDTLISRFIQYRTTFTYKNPAHLPVLFEVQTSYRDDFILVMPNQYGAGLPGDTLEYSLSVLNYTLLDDVIEISSTGQNPDWYYELEEISGNPLGDADDDGSPDAGLITANGGSSGLTLKVGIPETAVSETMDRILLFARSSNTDTLYDSAIITTEVSKPPPPPGPFLHNYPNPFSSETTVEWTLPEAGDVRITLADRTGRYIETVYQGACEAGIYSQQWQARTASGEELAPGVYIFIMDFKPQDGPERRILCKSLCTGRRQQ